MVSPARVAVVVSLTAALLLVPTLVAGSTPDPMCGTTLSELGMPLRTTLPDPAVESAGTAAPVGESWRIGSGAPATVASVQQASDVWYADWEEIDKIATRLKVPAGQRYVVRFDRFARQLVEIRPEDPLTDLARQAVDWAPDWLADELADNLRRLPVATQDVFADLILDTEDPIVDEVAFQVAHLGKGPLTHVRFRPELLVTNARLMYEHDPLLDYVQIVDHGMAGLGGDYYSTTRYLVTTPDNPIMARWVEIPRDVYYWFVVHPKLSDETVKDSNEVDERQSTYGYFWREYLFSNPDPAHDYTSNSAGEPYPVLGTVLQQPGVLWDGKAVDLPGDRPFLTADVALDVIGHWVSSLLPDKAMGNRPVQPNQIAYEHNGNCGEIQDLLGAAARTALIPNVLIADPCEDHVWNEFFSASPSPDWYPYQVDWDGGPTRIARYNIAYDKDQGGGKDDSGISAWRSDGLMYDVVDRYSKAASLVIHVTDARDRPVDGARVMIFSEVWVGSGFYYAGVGQTHSSGTAQFRVGDLQNYYVRVETDTLGNLPTAARTVTRIVENSEADKTYTYTAKLSGNLPRYDYTVEESTGEGYALTVRFDATDEIIYGANPMVDSLDFTDWRRPGQVDFLAFDAANFALFADGTAAIAAAASENAASGTVDLRAGDGRDDRYLVFTNEDHAVTGQMLDAEITLYRNPAAAPLPIYLPVAYRQAVAEGL